MTEEIDQEPTDVEETEEGTPIEEDLPDEPKDPKVRTKMGRRFSEMQEEQKAMKNKMDNMEYLMQSINEKLDKPAEPEVSTEDFDPYDRNQIREEARRILAEEKSKSNDYNTKAKNAFIRHVIQTDYDEATISALWDDAAKNWDDTGNAETDGLLNFRAAENRFLRSKLSRKPNPLEKNDGDAENLGGESSSSNAHRAKTVEKLDDETRAYMKARGMSSDEVQEKLRRSG